MIDSNTKGSTRAGRGSHTHRTGESKGVVGINADLVSEWIASVTTVVDPPLTFSLIAGGRSNLTFQVRDGKGRTLVLRRPPVSHVLATAHDMAREYRIMTALGPTGVPVPITYGLCEDQSVNDAPFYIMEDVKGHILRTPTTVVDAFDEEARHAIGIDVIRTLGSLHSVDIDQVGLGDFAKRDGYIERQLKRWGEQYRQMAVSGVDHGTLVEDTQDALMEANPGVGPTSCAIVHGDYRLDNLMIASVGKVAAILDWEICTLGDPMADLGLLMVYWRRPDDGEPFLGDAAPTTAKGFPTRESLLQEYSRRTNKDVSNVAYYMAFGYWKLACILQGVYARYMAGASAGDEGSVDAFPRTVERLARLAQETLQHPERAL